MRNILYFLLILTISCSNLKSSQNGDLQLKILEPNINDNTEVEVELMNKTNKKYYLLLDTTSFHHEQNFYLGSSLLYSMNFSICDKFNNCIPQELKIDCEYIEHIKNFEQKYFTSKNILKIGKGETIKIKIPFKMKYGAYDYCQARYKTELMKKGTEYYVQLISNEPNEYLKTILSKEVQDSLGNLNYKLYDRGLESNKVRLNFDIK